MQTGATSTIWVLDAGQEMKTEDFVFINQHPPAARGKLVKAEQLLEQLFDPEARPSLRWLRTQTKAKAIAHVRIGHLVFFDVDMVRAALHAKNLVRGRHEQKSASTGGR